MSSPKSRSRSPVLHGASKREIAQDSNRARLVHATTVSSAAAANENLCLPPKLRRRAGSLNLKASKTNLGPSSSHASFQNASLRLNVSVDPIGQRPSTTSVISSSKHPIPARKEDTEEFKLRSVSSVEAAAFYRSATPASEQLVILKPIKRLPRYQSPSFVRANTPKPAKVAEEEQYNTTGVSGLSTTTSTISLSQFPQPPLTGTRATGPLLPASNDREETAKSSGTENKQIRYFFRGASFDLLNPHNSFGLHKIEDETPAEQEVEPRDYFTASSQREKIAARQASASEMAAMTAKGDASEEKSTPKPTTQRPLFDDLPSAYNSIISRSGRKVGAVKEPFQAKDTSKEIVLPTAPVPSKLAKSSVEQFAVADTSTCSSLNDKKSPRKSISAAFKQRLSAVFSGRKLMDKQSSAPPVPSCYKPNSESKNVTLSSDDDEAELSLIFGYADGSVTTKNAENSSDINKSSPLKVEDEASKHYYDDESLLASSAVRESRVAHDPAPSPGRETPWTFRGQLKKDPSNGNLIDMYAYAFGDQEREVNPSGQAVTNGSHLDVPLGSRENELSTNSTIGEILDQYRQRDASFSELPRSPKPQPPYKEGRNISNSAPHLLDASMTPATKFDFGPFYQQKEFFHPELAARHVRQATARALLASATAPPNHALPSEPSNLNPPNYNVDESDVSDATSVARSEIDTRKLLLLSETSIEQARGYNNENISNKQATSFMDDDVENTEADRDKEQLYLPQFDPEYKRNSIRSEPNDTFNSDIKYLRHMSSISNMTGSVFILRNSASLPDQPSEPQQCGHVGYEHEMSASKLETPTKRPRSQPTVGPRTPVQADCAPIAAFDRSSVVPGFLRFSPSPKGTKSTDNTIKTEHGDFSPSLSSSSDHDYRPGFADDQDWETIPESRPTLKSISIGPDHVSSLADHSSYESLNTFRNIGVHPGDGRYQHTYRLRRSPSNSEDPVLMPSYDFRDGSGFPYRNALTPPNPAIYTYRHPVPLSQTHPNPFTSSPPQFDTGSQPRSPDRETSSHGVLTEYEPKTSAQIPNIPPRSNLRPTNHLSIVHEQTGESRISDLEKDRKPVKGDNAYPAANNFIVTTVDSSDWVSYAETNDEGPVHSASSVALGKYSFDCDVEKGEAHPILNEITEDAALVRLLREDDPRMASSPLSRSNSFNKLSYLGPKANITGSPNGTGMKEVGSSLVGSSSPFDPAPSSSFVPHKAPLANCASPSSAYTSPSRPSLFVKHVRSPLVNYNQTHEDSVTYREAMQRTRAQEKMPKRSASLRDALLSVGRKPSNKYYRRAVSGQKGLLDMKLGGPEKTQPPNPANGSENTNFFDEFSYQDTAESQNGHLLLPYRHKTYVSVSNPRIIERHRSPSSYDEDLTKCKQRISWAVFCVLFFLPPLLVVFGHGYMDSFGGMLFLSKGRISHFGRRQKCLAKWVGYTVTISIIVAVTIALIVIETTPNNLPRD